MAATDENFQQRLVDELALFFRPLVRVANDPPSGRVYDFFFVNLGWYLPAVLGSNAAAFESKLKALATAVKAIEDAGEPQGLGDLLGTLDTVGDAIDALKGLKDVSQPLNPDWSNELRDELLATLLVIHLRTRAPVLLAVLDLLRLVDVEQVAETSSGRRSARVPILQLDSISGLLKDPGAELSNFYSFSLATQAAADQSALEIFPRVAKLLALLGGSVVVGAGTYGPELSGFSTAAFRTYDSLLTFSQPFRLADGTLAEIGATLGLVGADNGGPGLLVAPFGASSVTSKLGRWQVDLSIGADVPAMIVKEAGVTFAESTPAGVELGLKLTKPPVGGAAFRIGSTTGTRLEVGTFLLTGSALLRSNEQNHGFEVEAKQAKLVLKPGDGDGFLQKLLPPEGVEAKFDLAIGWSNLKGVYFRGSAGLELTLPVHASLLGVVTIDSVYVAILLESNSSDLEVALAITASAKLGPVLANVEKMGLEATLAFPAGGGNLGPASLDKFGFKPPSGVGLSIDAGAVSGGGYLSFDAAKGEYAGSLYLSFNKISLTAIGLLNTKLPGGQSGFSLLIIITARFPPIQLGFGFTLTGVGGLLGINRTVVVGALQSAVKSHTLDAFLFPTLPIANPQQLVSSVSAAFPPAEGRYVFGPVVQINWGSPKLLTIELGIALELPEPVRLVVMGRIKLALPDDASATVVLQMDVLGFVDFGERYASVDATLVDSKIGSFPVTGDMAMRASWGSTRTFALSVGGFHPSFAPPSGFPTLNRLAIALASGDNPRVRLESYVAVTSNTAQVGANLDIYACVDLGNTIGKYTVQALFGFDALFHFHPFSLIANMSAAVSLKRNDKDFASVSLSVTLTGPKPWHAWGTATFEFLKTSHSIDFDVQIGGSPPADALPTADLQPALIAAIKDSASWSAQLPPVESMAISLREFTSQSVLAHPLGRIEFHERVVPLNVTISRVGNAVPSGADRFELGVTVNGATPSPAPDPVKDDFAPAQFFDLSDAEKLARPSFEQFDAGFRFATGAVTQSGPASQTTFAYEVSIIDIRTSSVRTLLPFHQRTDIAYLLAQGVHKGPSLPTYAGLEFDIVYEHQTFAVATRSYLTAQLSMTNLGYTEAATIVHSLNASATAATSVQVVHQSEAKVVAG